MRSERAAAALDPAEAATAVLGVIVWARRSRAVPVPLPALPVWRSVT